MNGEESERLARIETKLDIALADSRDMELRIRVLERRDAYVLGICATISFITPIVTKKIFGP
jgi:hypothetical protein